jgi:hypothetical protein
MLHPKACFTGMIFYHKLNLKSHLCGTYQAAKFVALSIETAAHYEPYQ